MAMLDFARMLAVKNVALLGRIQQRQSDDVTSTWVSKGKRERKRRIYDCMVMV